MSSFVHTERKRMRMCILVFNLFSSNVILTLSELKVMVCLHRTKSKVASPFGAIHMQFSKHETTINRVFPKLNLSPIELIELIELN